MWYDEFFSRDEKLTKFSLGNEDCLNVFCSSSSAFKYDRQFIANANNAAAEAIKLSHDYGLSYLDESVNSKMFLTETILKQIVQRCAKNGDWTLLRNHVQSVFSDRQNLSSSFLQKGFPVNTSLQKDAALVAASATSKSNFRQFFLRQHEVFFQVNSPRIRASQ